MDSFVGRDNDLVLLEEILASSRLGTVLGPGGIGKTRLCQQFALEYSHSNDPPGGVWFCDLSDARTSAGVSSAVAAAQTSGVSR